MWKSRAKVLICRSSDPLRQQVEGYARLLGVLVAHWLLVVSGWQYDRLSAVDALHILRAYVPLLQHALTTLHLFSTLMQWLLQELQAAAPLPKRRKTPLAFQLWYNFDASTP